MSLSNLRDKLKKLFFLNNLIIVSGSESIEAMCVLEDEIKELDILSKDEVADRILGEILARR